MRVSEAKLTSLWAKNCTTTQQALITKFAFGPKKVTGTFEKLAPEVRLESFINRKHSHGILILGMLSMDLWSRVNIYPALISKIWRVFRRLSHCLQYSNPKCILHFEIYLIFTAKAFLIPDCFMSHCTLPYQLTTSVSKTFQSGL